MAAGLGWSGVLVWLVLFGLCLLSRWLGYVAVGGCAAIYLFGLLCDCDLRFTIICFPVWLVIGCLLVCLIVCCVLLAALLVCGVFAYAALVRSPWLLGLCCWFVYGLLALFVG